MMAITTSAISHGGMVHSGGLVSGVWVSSRAANLPSILMKAGVRQLRTISDSYGLFTRRS